VFEVFTHKKVIRQKYDPITFLRNCCKSVLRVEEEEEEEALVPYRSTVLGCAKKKLCINPVISHPPFLYVF